MFRSGITLTGHERIFADNEVIVSKTDTRGIITYVNRTFLNVAGYTRGEVMGKPHNIIRHPAMPMAAFKLLWQRIKSSEEIFAYVINCAKNGDHYWVFAHVTPTFDNAGKIIGYHSNRRAPSRQAINTITPLYEQLCAIESAAPTPREGAEQAMAALQELLAQKGCSYDEFILSIG